MTWVLASAPGAPGDAWSVGAELLGAREMQPPLLTQPDGSEPCS